RLVRKLKEDYNICLDLIAGEGCNNLDEWRGMPQESSSLAPMTVFAGWKRRFRKIIHRDFSNYESGIRLWQAESLSLHVDQIAFRLELYEPVAPDKTVGQSGCIMHDVTLVAQHPAERFNQRERDPSLAKLERHAPVEGVNIMRIWVDAV